MDLSASKSLSLLVLRSGFRLERVDVFVIISLVCLDEVALPLHMPIEKTTISNTCFKHRWK